MVVSAIRSKVSQVSVEREIALLEPCLLLILDWAIDNEDIARLKIFGERIHRNNLLGANVHCPVFRRATQLVHALARQLARIASRATTRNNSHCEQAPSRSE
jgi:hypothetical protein